MRKTASSIAAITLAAITMLLLAFFWAAPVHAAVSWNVQTVDVNGAGMGNGHCPIILDSSGMPLIAYTGYNPPYQYGIVKYAGWNGSSWSIQEVDSFAHAFDLKLDANGNPHILYGLADLKYASWTGSSWSIQTVDAHRMVYASLALDSAGNPHAAYSDGEAVRYASRNGSTWTIQTVDTYSEIPFQVSLALDSNDTPQILYNTPTSYEDQSTGVGYRSMDVKLATLENSVWKIQTVPLPPPIGGYSNLVLDSKDYPHFIFALNRFASPPEDMTLLSDLLYASWNGTSWETQTAVSNVSLYDGFGIGFLALDSLDYPYISYINSAQVLICAAWTGVDWSIQTVNTGLSVRGPCYLAVDSNRIPHISFLAIPPNEDRFSALVYLMYAEAVEPIETPEPPQPPLPFPVFPLLLVSAVVVMGAVGLAIYVLKKKTQTPNSTGGKKALHERF